ncbi:MAG: AAA family ATPase, partial [Clostridiales bacterium]|nr:AAA family ATPase [Clostridiales bacterium]
MKTEFFEQQRQKKYVPELTGVFYFSFSIKLTRVDGGAQVKYCFDKDYLPWYARSFMSPKYLKSTPDVATVMDVDNYKSETTEQRSKIKNWKEYVDYCENLFNKTADLTLAYEPKCFIFRYDINREKIVEGILQLYEEIEKDISNHRLYNNFIDVNFSNSSLLINNSSIAESCKHCGQMNGKFPLAYSQRQAVHHMNLINSGEILAVSGPPGTGKTTLLQSIVADMVVKSVLNSEDPPPVIVATSTNNQAVTNIIDSFSSIKPIGIRNLEKRWVNGVKSFATYMPSSSKEIDAKKNGYQYTTVFKREFIQDTEDLIDDSILKMKKEAGLYFDKIFSNIDDIKQEMKTELICIDDLKKKLLSISAKINEITDGLDLIAYITELDQSKTDAENQYDKYKE